LSVVLPLESTGDDPGAICQEARRILSPLVKDYEVICVDDATEPSMRAMSEAAQAQFPEVRLIRLKRRMGASAAIAIGAGAARGEFLLTLDPYMHVSLEDVPKLLGPLRNGADLVCGWRTPRRDSGLSRVASRTFNALARWLTKVPVHDLNCRTRAMRREVIQDVPLYGDLHRFLPVFAASRGYTWCEVQVPQEPGKQETGAFRLRNYARRFLDLVTLIFLTRFVRRPLRVFGLIGMASFVAGMAISIYLSYVKLVVGEAIGHRPLLLLGTLLVVVGIQIGSIGLLGELIVFTHARDLKEYVVKQKLE
jgi:hypothetical protein